MKTTAIENDTTTYCKGFDNSCYHHQCIAYWTAVIMLQVLIGHWGEKRCEKLDHLIDKNTDDYEATFHEVPFRLNV